MYILLETCMHPGVLRIIYFIFLILDVIFIVVPIGLILMLLFDFTKAMISNPDDAKKNSKLAVKRIIYAIIIFAIPWLVNVFNYTLTEIGLGIEYNTCIERAKTGDFSYYDELYDKEQELLNAEIQARIKSNVEAKKQLEKVQEEYKKINNSNTTLAGGMNIPIYYQSDYSDVILSGKKTVASSGCGFASTAMIVSYLKGEKITPRELVDDWSRKYYVYDVGMSFGLPQAAATHYKLGTVTQTASIDAAYKALKEGHPVMSSQGAGLFTSGAHLIVLRGVNSDGKILVNDPNKNNAVNKDYNNRAFSKSEIAAAGTQYFIWPKK